MRILVVTNMYPPHHLGGYELVCRDTVERWRVNGHDVTVLTTDIRLPGVSTPDEAGIRRDLTFYWKDHEILSPPLRQRLRMERRNQRALRSALDDLRPDVVSFWHMGAMSLGLMTTVAERGMPAVLVVHDDWLVYGRATDAWSRLFRGRPLLARVVRRLTGVPTTVSIANEAVSFVSEYTRQRAVEHGAWSFGRSTVLHGGIDRREFAPPSDAKAPWTYRLLCVGRVEERKGVHVAVGALALLPPQSRLDVYGPVDDRYLERLRSSANAVGVAERVRFGVVPRSELREVYGAADVFLFPVTWDEPFGLTPVEAMACGTPVVGTGTGGSAEFLVDEVNCLVVPPNDTEALAEAVRRLADDPELRARLVRNGLETAARVDIETFASDLERWHIAAAERFEHGTPPDRPPLRVSLSSLGPEPSP